MHELLPSPRALVAGTVILSLAGCRTPTQSYDGPSLSTAKIARVVGRKEANLLEAVNDPRGSRPGPGMPEAILIVDVDGVDLKEASDFVEVLPGPRALGIYGRRFEMNPDRIVSNLVTLEFEAKAGEIYSIKAKASERQRPWSYDLLNQATQVVVATSEPTLEELDLVALPSEADGWNVHSFSKTRHYSHATYAALTDTDEEPTDYLQRERSTIPDDLDFEANRYRRIRQRKLAGYRVEDSDLEGNRWMERWRSQQPDESGLYQLGVGVYRAQDRVLYSIIYITQSGSFDDHAAELRLDQWQQRIVQEN